MSNPGRMAAAGPGCPERLMRKEHGERWEHGRAGLENQAVWNPDLIPKQEEDCKEEAKLAQAWVQGTYTTPPTPRQTPKREEELPKDAVLPLPQLQGSPGEPGHMATLHVPSTTKEEGLWRSGEPGRMATSQFPCEAKEEGLWRSDNFEEVTTGSTAPLL